jgi:hypothetical protein
MNRNLDAGLKILAGLLLLAVVAVSAQSWYTLRSNESLRAGLLSIAVGVAVATFVRREPQRTRAVQLRVVSNARRSRSSRREKAETADALSGQTIRLRSLLGTRHAARRANLAA